MTSRELEIFHAVMSSRSLTEAAASLGVSQPALSKALKRLEDKLRMPLFRRIKGRLRPTLEAESLFPESARLIGEIARLSSTAAALRDGEGGVLSVAASASLGVSVVPIAIGHFGAAFPKVKVISHFAPARAAAQLVAGHHADLALCLSPVGSPGTVTQSLGTIPMVCALHPDHRLTRRPQIHASDLVGERLISFGSDTYHGRLLDDAFARDGARRLVAVEIATAIQVPALVLQGAGVAVVDAYMAAAGFAGIAWRPFAPQVLLPVNVVTSTTRPPSRLATSFVERFVAALRAFPMEGPLLRWEHGPGGPGTDTSFPAPA